jgi:hypothetical protein
LLLSLIESILKNEPKIEGFPEIARFKKEWRLIPNGDKSAMFFQRRPFGFSIPTSSSSKKREDLQTPTPNPLRKEKSQQSKIDEGLADLNRTMPIFVYRLGYALAIFAQRGGKNWVEHTPMDNVHEGSSSKVGGGSSSRETQKDDLDHSKGSSIEPQVDHFSRESSGCWIEVLGPGIRLWRVPPLKYSTRSHNLEDWAFAMQSILLAFKYIVDVSKA